MTKILSDNQLADILYTWATIGPDAARELAPKYGVKTTYIKKLAKDYKVRAARKRNQDHNCQRRIPRDQDPRWERAKAIGMIII